MTARRPRLDDASEAYIARVLATFPPFSESDKIYLSRLITPPANSVHSGTAAGHDVRYLPVGGGRDDLAA